MPYRVIKTPHEIALAPKLGAIFLIAVAGLIGIIQAFAWILQEPRLVQLWTGQALMSFNTSVLVVAAALGIGSLFWGRTHRLTSALGTFIIAFSLTSFSKHIFGVGLSLSNFITDTMGMVTYTSVYSSIALFFVGLCILAYVFPKIRLIQIQNGLLSVCVMAIGISSAVAHIFHFMPPNNPTGLGSLALSTATALSCLGLALSIIESHRLGKEDYSWLPPMTGTFTLGITLIIWQVIRQSDRVDEVIAPFLLVSGLIATVLFSSLAYFALQARRLLKIARNKENELRELNSVLEEKVRSRTQELENSNIELERFASMAAHDLKSPVNSMMQFAELLSEEADSRINKNEKEYIDYIIRAGNRASRMIDSLLDFAKSGRSKGRYEILDANSIAKAAAENLHYEVMAAKAQIEIQALPTICGDRIQLTQTFQNLLANAIKFRKKNQAPQIKIKVESENVCWRFSIIDNGIGIDPSYSNSIFDLFSRLHSEAEFEGTGLGLAMCRKIIENHKGRIWVESKAGEGTTFHFTLPKVQSEESHCHT